MNPYPVEAMLYTIQPYDNFRMLAQINPYWSQGDWREMLHEHLIMTKQEAVDMLTKNYDAGISQYDAIEKQALKMADVMAGGIASQFPNKFPG